ncbi:MAG TPA: 3-hydroxyacyl-CoA dehydrogenase family protein [Candidatus Acidoferrales bacterium]
MQIKTIAIIGAGPTGRAIAYLSILAGYQTILEAVSQEFLDDAVTEIRDYLKNAVATGSITPQQETQARANLETSRSVEDVCRAADLLIESAQEELEVKLEIFTLFDKFAKPAAILATSSQTIPITDLAEITFRGENCVALRFENPLSPSGRLEIIQTKQTSEETVTASIEVGKRMGRKILITRS